jgi:hypothetical protein
VIYGQASVTVTASPSEVLDFVCDLTRYRTADTKIGKVLSVEPDGDDQIACFRSRLRDVPGPLVRQRIHRTGDTRIDITDMPSWQNRLVTFRGLFTCEPTKTGTLVMHREEFDFHGPMRLIAEPFLRTWLAADVKDEVTRMSRLLGDAQAERRDDLNIR